jgi:hypothetical protein
MIPSHSNHLLHSSPDFPPLSAFSSLSGLCSGGSSDPCFSPIPLSSTSSLSSPPMAVRHHLSIEDPDPVGTVRRFTPSTNVDALDVASSLTPLFATLTENTGGWGYKFSNQESPLPSEALIFTSLLHFFTLPSLPFHTPTPATPIPSCAYFTVLCIPNFFQFSPPHRFTSTAPCPLPIRKQAPAPAVIQPSGPVCPGGA